MINLLLQLMTVWVFFIIIIIIIILSCYCFSLQCFLVCGPGLCVFVSFSLTPCLVLIRIYTFGLIYAVDHPLYGKALWKSYAVTSIPLELQPHRADAAL